MLKRLWNYKKVRFLCIGSFNSLVDITILNTLVYVGHLPIWLSNVFSVSVGITVSYFLNHFLVFRHQHKPNIRLFFKFFIITGIGVIALQTIIIALTHPMYTDFAQSFHSLSDSLQSKISLNLAKVTAILIGMVWNYLFYSKVVFKKTLETKTVEEITKLV